MNAGTALTIARKDLSVALRRRSTLVGLVVFPVIVAVGLPLVLRRVGARTGGAAAAADLAPRLLDAFTFFLVIGSAVLPTAIAAYSLVGEKVERSLEPLLATPASELEILLGKAVAALVPTVLALWVGAAVFVVNANQQTMSLWGRTYLPDTEFWITVCVVVPLAALFSVLASVLVSVRVTDVRTAQQLAGLMVIPFGAVYVLSEVGVFDLSAAALLWIAAGLLVLDVVLFVGARAVFDREEILTRWR
jgi:ABC-2 type transport system permease protein